MYIRHLFQSQELLGLRLLSFHNVWFYSTLMAEIRAAIPAGGLKELCRRVAVAYAGAGQETADKEESIKWRPLH